MSGGYAECKISVMGGGEGYAECERDVKRNVQAERAIAPRYGLTKTFPNCVRGLRKGCHGRYTECERDAMSVSVKK